MKIVSSKKPQSEDNDLRKGATEDNGGRALNSMQGQQSHRESNAEIKGSDSDFPEPGSNPEHSGQSAGNQNSVESDGDRTIEPGFSQKMNQNWRKEDPLAS